jgi:hypothetical protein
MEKQYTNKNYNNPFFQSNQSNPIIKKLNAGRGLKASHPPKHTITTNSKMTTTPASLRAYDAAVQCINLWIQKAHKNQPLDFSSLTDLNMLPPIPHGVKILNISNTAVDTLDELPPQLEELWMSNSKVNAISVDLPQTLKSIHCKNTPLTDKPQLPPSIVRAVF